MFELRPYQKDLLDRINASKDTRNCIQAATGFGKTAVFSHLANNYKGRVLILVNRVELLDQTVEIITRTKSLITAKTKKVGTGEVLIGMVESVNNRIKKGVFNLDNIDLIIVDEIQNLQFTKVFEGYTKRLLGFTATPTTMKTESYFKCKYCDSKTDTAEDCCGKETKKYTLKVSLKRWYGNLIQGISIGELIDLGYLTPVHNLSCDISNLDKLKVDSSGDFSKKSQDEVFNNLASTENLLANYKEHCIGKKTMVFNSNIKANEEAYKMFKMEGYNVRSYDSKSKENRKEMVEWFKNTPDGILMSVGVFTTGFSVSDVEAIILNKATNSLSLVNQIVGRRRQDNR
jgi:superfamily II DNA or RNA helicase